MSSVTSRRSCADWSTRKASSKAATASCSKGTPGCSNVSRGKLSGQAFDALKDKPLGEDALEKVYGGKLPESHMANFFDCIGTARTRSRMSSRTTGR